MKEKFYSEEYKEEQKRLKKGDPKGDKKGRPFLHPYIPANEIPDSGSINIEEKLDKKTSREDIPEIPSETEIAEQLRISQEKMSEEAGFIRKKDTAHAGPEFYKKEPEKGIDLEKEERGLEKENEKVISASKETKSYGKDSLYRKSVKVMTGKTAKGKENLKTMPDAQKERSIREKIRNIWHNISGN